MSTYNILNYLNQKKIIIYFKRNFFKTSGARVVRFSISNNIRPVLTYKSHKCKVFEVYTVEYTLFSALANIQSGRVAVYIKSW